MKENITLDDEHQVHEMNHHFVNEREASSITNQIVHERQEEVVKMTCEQMRRYHLHQ